ncbi:hypothetical protein [Spiroplasma endosymbiont of Stenodema calcarata]|uniref:hypothetical protein n=1 Tax=Spiroplasma endosymbiont of Stenodema calcarata TaxID=3139328 RepID=UPI003CCB711B
MGIKIGIDPSGTGTTAITVYENNILKQQIIYTDKYWLNHAKYILGFLIDFDLIEEDCFLFIENCLYTTANASKDRDDLLKLLGAIENDRYEVINWISPKYTKSVVKNIENLSKYNDGCLWKYEKDTNLTYQYGKGWKYNNEKISNHLRDAIIIANYEGK